MKLAIIGSRNFTDSKLARQIFSRYFGSIGVKEIVSGGAVGADTCGKIVAQKFGLKLTEYIPDWKKYGKSAGFVRNREIIENSDMVLAFWDGKSKGTQNSLSVAKNLKKDTFIIYF